MIRSTSRSGAEVRYRDLRRIAFQAAEIDLGIAGISAQLRSIDATAIAAFAQWSGRLVSWPWAHMATDWRRNHPDRFEAAVWSGGVLCALALGRPSRTAAHMSLYYLEGNPDRANPLRHMLTAVVLAALRSYAVALGKSEIRLVDPLPAVVPFYCSPALGFQLVKPAKGSPYCWRSI